jgi:Ca-activated chloride channel family protein
LIEDDNKTEKRVAVTRVGIWPHKNKRMFQAMILNDRSRKTLVVLFFMVTALYRTVYSQQPAAISEPAGPIVKLPLIVIDSKNQSVDAIRKEGLQVIESKVEQKVLTIERDERPIDIAIAIDSSGSFRDLIPYAIEAAKRIINDRRPTDEIFVEKFISSDKISTLQEFTTDRSALLLSLLRLRPEGGQSAVLDAIYVGADHLWKHKPDEDRRKALIIITDGEERNSFYKTEDVINLLQEKGVQVFALAITTKLDGESVFIRQSPKERAEKFLKKLADESGGRVFYSKTPKQLDDGTEELIRSLRTSLRLTFKSSNTSAIKGFRKVEVKQIPSGADKYTVIAARGYFFSRGVNVSNKTPSQ